MWSHTAKSSESCEGPAASRQQSQSVEDNQNESIGVDSSVAKLGYPVDEENQLHDEPHQSLDGPQQVNADENRSQRRGLATSSLEEYYRQKKEDH